jgi:hypothetical protein
VILCDRWANVFVLNVHASTEGKSDDTKHSFCAELERVLSTTIQAFCLEISIKEEMGGACSTHGRDDECTTIFDQKT